MNYSTLVLLPNQLYNIDLSKYRQVYLVEEPLYFYDRVKRPLRYHKTKLAYLRTCMKSYHALYPHIIYIDYHHIEDFYKVIKNTQFSMYDPVDHDVSKKYTALSPNLIILTSPNFVMSLTDLHEFHKPNKHVLHARFFDFVKRKLNILKGQSSMDKHNQQPLNSSLALNTPLQYTSPHHKEAMAYVEQHWSKNPGTYNGLTLWPSTHKQALQHLRNFLKNKFLHFGTYQDAINPNDPFMYHSTISPALNTGLLTPMQVLHEIMKYKNKVPINSLEGFLRQLIGWREYMRYLYVFHHYDYMSVPIPKKRIDISWYNGTTGFHILDNEIRKCLNETGGYAHHIIRLMVFLNIFILLRIHPEDIYKWFMEVCAIDAYDWVMRPNIYCMGYFYTKAMSKPYISTSNYIVKMSSRKYKNDPKWDALFHKYIKEVRPTAYIRNIKT